MNELIDRAVVLSLRDQLRAAAPDRDFSELVPASAAVDGRSLRERADLVAAAVLTGLPSGFDEASAIIRSALVDPRFSGWRIWPVGDAVAELGLRGEAVGRAGSLEDALELLAELTPRLSAEFSIRRLLAHDLDRSLAVVSGWTAHSDEHVRRLASEGTRSFLPWATRVPALLANPDATLPLLDALHRDDSDYVRRSVANHLNDLSRENPALVVETAARWTAGATGDPTTDANTTWVVRHALRSLIKKGDPGALALQGYGGASVTVSELRLDTAIVEMPGALSFEVEITNAGEAPARLAVDYVVHYLKASGAHAAKVFKLTAPTLEPGETRTIAKRHVFKPITTRVHYAGEHHLELQVNGVRHGRVPFQLHL